MDESRNKTIHSALFSPHNPFDGNYSHSFKVVPGGCHRYFFGVKVKTVKLIDDGIHSDHGYLDTCDNPLGPP